MACLSAASIGGAATPPVDFGRQVLPVLQKRCFACHAGTRREGGLWLDRPEGLTRGGDSGPAVLPGKGADSPLIHALEATHGRKRMPPAGPALERAQIDAIRSWIDQGAAWPAQFLKAQAERTHWSFRRPTLPPVPATSQDASPIDAFVRVRLKQEGLRPSPPADRSTLLRRLSLDLTGLLPSPRELDSFLADRGPDAIQRQVDRLLASPHFGERWGRHWLDLARYADSDGYEKDLPRPTAYLYRDWVIRAINTDMPFDQFTVEQLAGDLLPNATLDQKIATGFHRNTLKNREGGIDPEEDRVKCNVDRVSTTGTVWLGLTVACGECHTHKYDPLTQREFYGLYAFFNSAQELDLPTATSPAPGMKPADVPKAMVFQENPKPPPTHVHIRGDFLRKGPAVQAGTPGFLTPLSAGSQPSRLDLARWLMSPENPLTARVTVNRVWQHLFGRGIVATPDDFGSRGERPSHPELLDWLAVRFSTPADQGGWGWSLKRLIREIILTQTYRQASTDRPELRLRDPRNILLARQSRFRPEAEIVRDLYLSAGGLLHPEIGGPSIRPPLPADIAALGYAGSVKWAESKAPERYKRGMYVFYQRTVPYPMLSTFDAPDANNACTRRERSNTPLQALTLLNDPVFHEAAQALGRRLVREQPERADRLRQAFRICLAREPESAESARLLELEARAEAAFAAAPAKAAEFAGTKGEAGAAEAAGWTLVSRVILNLDEFVTRE